MPLKVGHHQPASDLVFRLHADNGPPLEAGMVA